MCTFPAPTGGPWSWLCLADNGGPCGDAHAVHGGGRWQDDWHVDMGYGVVNEEMDRDGWTYGKTAID
jgi:hypothetical protein